MPEWEDTDPALEFATREGIEPPPLVVWHNTAHYGEVVARGEVWQAWAAGVGGYPGYRYAVNWTNPPEGAYAGDVVAYARGQADSLPAAKRAAEAEIAQLLAHPRS